MKSSLIKRILAPIPLLIMLCVIFLFSSQDGTSSGGLSSGLGRAICEIFFVVFKKGATADEITAAAEAFEPFLRKGAHVTEYFILNFTVFLPVTVYCTTERHILATESSAYALAKLKKGTYHSTSDSILSFPLRLIVTCLLSVALAAFDELHQYFVPGRDGRVLDVAIDSIGIALSAALIIIVYLLISRNRRKRI